MSRQTSTNQLVPGEMLDVSEQGQEDIDLILYDLLSDDDSGDGVQLSRGIRDYLKANAHNSELLSQKLDELDFAALVEAEKFLWQEALDSGMTALGSQLNREYITRKMEPTADYHRRMLCSEPLTACRANYCIKSNPGCAARKIKQNIKAISSVFNRRSSRGTGFRNDLRKIFSSVLADHGLFAITFTDATLYPIVSVSEFDSKQSGSGSGFIRVYYDYLKSRDAANDPINEAGKPYDLPLKIETQAINIGSANFVLNVFYVEKVDSTAVSEKLRTAIFRIYLDNMQFDNDETTS